MIPQCDLRVEVERSDAQLVLTLTAPLKQRSEPFFITRELEGRLRDLQRSLPTRLQKFHQEIVLDSYTNPDLMFDQIDEALFHLRAIGNDFVDAICPEPRDKKSWIEVLTAALLPHLNRRTEPARIDFVIEPREFGWLTLPLEILPIMDPQGHLRTSSGITDMTRLRQSLLVFPAFAAIITRRLERPFDPFPALQRQAHGKVPIKVIRNDEFYRDLDEPVEVSEVEWLYTQDSIFEVEPPWPDKNCTTERAASRKLGLCLINPYEYLADHLAPRDWSDQIQHFSCHYTATDDEHVLGLRGPPDPLHVSVSMLNLVVEEQRNAAPQLPPHAPLIFLNACGSGGAARYGGLSITELIELKAKPRAIVATITPVDFPRAAEFARAVYRGLMAELPLGRAVHEARWQLVEEARPPSLFGLLYILLGNPDLYIDLAGPAA
jgi:hypothetical protein